ncbi:DUF3048 domain-containing protein [Bacillaceae bacterium S4-13-56]
MKKATWLASFLLLIILLIGCSTSEETVTKKSTPLEERTVTPIAKETSTYVYPLTGEAIDEPSDQRVFAVMVNNHPKARPQSGLHKADIVYEVLAEGNVTRFLALFQSELPEVVGPVRSSRDYFIDLNNGYHSFYVAHGYSPLAKQMLFDDKVTDHINGIQYDGILFKRSSSRKAPHNSYITYENIKKGAEMNGYSLTETVKPNSFLSSKQADELDGQQVSHITVHYGSTNTVKYEYDESSQKYIRYSDGVQTVDLEMKIPIELDNIFIVEAPHRIIDDYGRRALDLEVGGKAYLLQRGILQEISWKNLDGRIIPFKDNKVVPFVKGKTWINIVPTSPGIGESVDIVE